MPQKQELSTEEKEMQNNTIEITDKMTINTVKDVLELERDNLYVNRPNLKEQIVTLIKAKVR